MVSLLQRRRPPLALSFGHSKMSLIQRCRHSCSVMGGHHYQVPTTTARSIATGANPFFHRSFPMRPAVRLWVGSDDRLLRDNHLGVPLSRKNDVCPGQNISQFQLQLLRWNSSSNPYNRRANRSRGPNMKHCRTIEEIAQVAYENLDSMWHKDISAFWTLVSRMVAQENSQNRNNHYQRNMEQQRGQLQQLTRQINAIMKLTMNELEMFAPRELVQTALGFARIAKALDNNSQRGRHSNGITQQILRRILIGQNSERINFIFQYIAHSALNSTSALFEPRYLSNLSYANAIAGCVPRFEDGTTLFDRIAKNSIPLLGGFDPQDLSNMVWAFQNLGQSNHELFVEVADHIVSLDSLRDFKPQELSNILLAYAKAGEHHPTLFNKAADHIVALPNLKRFNSHDVSAVVYAFAKAEVFHTDLFEKVGEQIISLDSLQSIQPQHRPMINRAYETIEGSSSPLHTMVSDRITGSQGSRPASRDAANDYTQNNKPPRGPDMRNCKSVEEISQIAYNHLENMSPRDISAFWTLVSKFMGDEQFGMGQLEEQQLERMSHQIGAILERTMNSMDMFGPRDFAQTALGIANIASIVEGGGNSSEGIHQVLYGVLIGQNSEQKEFIFQSIANAAVPSLSKFDAQRLRNLAYANAISGFVPMFEDGSTLFDRIAENCIQQLGVFKPQELANMVWSFEIAGQSNPMLMGEVAAHINGPYDLSDFKPREISNILLAFAKSGEQSPELFDKVADHIAEGSGLKQFEPQELSILVWAFRKAEELHPRLFEKVADYILSLDSLHAFRPRFLCMIAWAYAAILSPNLKQSKPREPSKISLALVKIEEKLPQLLRKVADHVALSNLRELDSQPLSNLLWACAKLNESHPSCFTKVADHIISLDNLDHFEPQAVANLLWAFANTRDPNPKLYKKVADHIISLDSLEEFNPQDLSTIVWSYATAVELHPKLFHKVAEHIAALDDLSTFEPQGMSNIAWAFAVADVDAPSLFYDDFINACLEKTDEFNMEELHQLHQWHLWQEELKSSIRLPPSLEEKCYKSFVSNVSNPSGFQNDVVSNLALMGLHPKEEVITPKGYSLDAVVEVNGKKVGIEVDGPFHFLGRKPNGSTILKRRQVTNLEDVSLVSVPYWEWNKLGEDKKKKQQYLLSLLGMDEKVLM